MAEGGRKLEVDVRPNGAILATGEVPAAVLQTVQARYADATVREAEPLTAGNGEISYEIEFTSGKHNASMTVTEAGVFVEEESGHEKD